MSKSSSWQRKRAGMVRTGQDPNIVSISLFLPYAGVDHAGGALLLNHYRVLAQRSSRLDAYAVAFDESVAAGRRHRADVHPSSYTPVVLNFPRWRTTLLGKILARLWFILLPLLPDIGILSAYLSSKPLRERIRQADIVELQWYENFFLARLVQRVNPNALTVGYVHDIPSQKWERRLTNWPRALSRVYMSYILWLQRRVLRGIDLVTVLSAKDADLMAAHANSVRTVVLDPPLDLPSSADGHRSVGEIGSRAGEVVRTFGFIGAFHRPENDDAALWLLSDIWPNVLERCPSAHLYLVGSKPSAGVKQAAEKFRDSVTVTGYVDDVDLYYRRFATVVIPLRYGAGVKFKTISAILAERNIVATPVAIEGTLPEDHFFKVADSAEELADAMVELATAPEAGREIIARARDTVGSRYALEGYAQAVFEAYGL